MTGSESGLKAQASYDGPTSISEWSLGGRIVRLVRPSEPDRLLDAPAVRAWNARDDYMPYWAYLWPGSFLLAEAVAAEPTIGAGVTALEIGCGLGLGGLVALGRGARVEFTDYDESALGFVARSAAENGFGSDRFTTAKLDWRELPATRYPVILGADVLYERRLVPLVANLLARLLAPGGVGLIAGPYRIATEGFEAALGPLGLTCAVAPMEVVTEEFGPVRGMLHRVVRKC